ncbi:hypothetical protein [Kitasatospora sp. NPDC047058]|uniref:hypothetical protein n=1 Tax=Kitasatospora sp. NPDC047058 TaxID=3155620 RepID=UPI0033C72A08
MANGYSVDLAALRDAAAGVNGTLDQLSRRSVTDIPHESSAIGDDHLAHTLSDFLSRWKRGVENLAEDGKEISTRLTASANAYAKAEQDAHQHLVQSGSKVSGGGTDPGVH